ncbi:MAG: hypothetical protein N2557_08560, partial [Hydrogenophilus sp.]|nr:hypothetical protein [Hydrogenophilus sp.]
VRGQHRREKAVEALKAFLEETTGREFSVDLGDLESGPEAISVGPKEKYGTLEAQWLIDKLLDLLSEEVQKEMGQDEVRHYPHISTYEFYLDDEEFLALMKALYPLYKEHERGEIAFWKSVGMAFRDAKCHVVIEEDGDVDMYFEGTGSKLKEAKRIANKLLKGWKAFLEETRPPHGG